MTRFPGWLGIALSRLFKGQAGAECHEQREGIASRGGVTPLGTVNRALRELEAAVASELTSIELVLDQVREIQDCAATAWCEREEMESDYYGMLRGLLPAIDDLERLPSAAGGNEWILERLRRLLADQGVEKMTVVVGSLFQSDLQECEESLTSNSPTGTILRVLEEGYVHRRKRGGQSIVRPARVIVSGSKPTREDRCDDEHPESENRH